MDYTDGRVLGNYKILQKQKIENNDGTTLLECILLIEFPLILNIIITILDVVVLNGVCVKSYSDIKNASKVFSIQFLILIFPIILLVTLLSVYIYWIWFTCAIVLCYYFYIQLSKSELQFHNLLTKRITDDKSSIITRFRAIVNIFSVICILAVDFNIFPRKFSKTEAYGYGLMDLGTGLYIISNGLTTSLNKTISHPYYVDLYNVFKKSFPLLLIGVGRYSVLNIINYQQHITEYGSHWNFFITLSMLKIINGLFIPLSNVKITVIVLFVLLIVHQSCLSNGLQEWIISDITSRNTFVSANREGIFSLPGYEILFFFGIIIKHILPKKGDVMNKYLVVVKRLLLALILCFLFTKLSESYVRISRRTVNIGYIFWLSTVSLLIIISGILLELFFMALFHIHSLHIPTVLEAINYNGLFFFLMANLLTGAINICVYTLYTNDVLSLLIITLYMVICTGVVTFLYHKKIRIF